MKICLVTSLYTPYKRGGAEVVAAKTVQQLVADGHEVIVVTHGYKDEVENIEGVKVYRIRPHNIFSYIDIAQQPFWKRMIWHLSDALNCGCAKEVKRIIQTESPDLVLAHALKGLGYLVPKYLADYPKPVVFTLHDVQLVAPSGLIILNHEKDFLVNNPYVWIYTILTRYLFSFAKIVVTPSDWLMKFYTERGFFKASKNLIFRNPVEIASEFVPKDFNYRYVFVGQVEEHKGIRLLLETFEKFHKEYPQAHLTIVGGGTLKEELEKKYNFPWVDFVGFVPYDELPDRVFKNASYSLLTSLCYENSPGTVYDGYANSTPVIVPRIGGSAELVGDGVTGYVFEPGSSESLMKALKNSIASAPQYQEIARAGYQKINSCSFRNYIDSILQLR